MTGFAEFISSVLIPLPTAVPSHSPSFIPRSLLRSAEHAGGTRDAPARLALDWDLSNSVTVTTIHNRIIPALSQVASDRGSTPN